MTDTEQVHTLTTNCLSIKKAYFDEVILPVFKQITEKIIPAEKYYRIAGRNICLRFYNDDLSENLKYALSHNEIDKPSRIDLTVHLWDTVSTHAQFTAPWINKNYFFTQSTETKNKATDNFMGVYLYGEETLTLYDRDRKTAYFWTHDAKLLPVWVSAAPIRTLLQWFLAETGVYLVHGAVIGCNGKAALITARGGSGKSTTALASVLSGMTYLGDDYVGIESTDTITAHSLYNSVKVSPSYVAKFLNLSPYVWNKEGEKSVLFLAPLFPQQVLKNSPLSAILIPVIKHHKKSVIVPATKAQAMLALMPTTLFQLPLVAANKIQILKKIIEKTPCYSIELSSDSDEVASAISGFLESSLFSQTDKK